MKITYTRKQLWIIGLVAFVLYLPTLQNSWIKRNWSQQDIDLETGRLRFTEYRLYRKVSERIEESALSRALGPRASLETEPLWRPVNTFTSKTKISPHYAFHGAFSQIHELEMVWRTAEDSGLADLEKFKKATSQHFIILWKHGGKFLASDYIIRLEELAYGPEAKTKLEAVCDLTMPLIGSDGNRITKTVFFPDGQPLERIQGYAGESGQFIRDGRWERWRPDGTRSVYGHFVNGKHDGPRFEWNAKGELSRIEAYDNGNLTKYVFENLADDPDFKTAQEIARQQPAPYPKPK